MRDAPPAWPTAPARSDNNVESVGFSQRPRPCDTLTVFGGQGARYKAQYQETPRRECNDATGGSDQVAGSLRTHHGGGFRAQEDDSISVNRSGDGP